MLINCPKCHTKFKLDESLVPEEGAWLRCSRCQEEFFTRKQPGENEQQFPPPMDTPRPDDPGIRYGNDAMADFGLDDSFSKTSAKKKAGKGRKLLALLLVLLILLVIALGAIVALDRLNLKPQWIDPLRNLPGLNLIIEGQKPTSGHLSLNNVRAYFRDNAQAGRLLIIQGEVVNLTDQIQSNVLVQGRLNDIHNQPARQAVIYAGPVFTLEQLRELPLSQIQSQLSQPLDANGQPYLLPPQGSLPFMIVLANPPDDSADYTADVVGWEVVAGQ